MAVDSNKRVYTWGFGGYGRLGHAEQKDEWRPRLVSQFDRKGRGAVKVWAGSTHTMALNELGWWFVLRSNFKKYFKLKNVAFWMFLIVLLVLIFFGYTSTLTSGLGRFSYLTYMILSLSTHNFLNLLLLSFANYLQVYLLIFLWCSLNFVSLKNYSSIYCIAKILFFYYP